MAQLEIRMLGGFDVALDGRPVTDLESGSTQALLAHLAVQPSRRFRRADLAEMMWPERPATKARANLRHSLAVLRRAIGDHGRTRPVLVGTDETIGVDPETEVWIDVGEFTRLAATPATTPGVVAAWERAADLWRGSFLAGFDPSLGEEWETWLLGTRGRLDAQATDILERLADLRERSGDMTRSFELTRRQLTIDRWNEPAHARLIRLLARAGRTADALRHGGETVTALRQELGVDPTDALTTAIEQARSGGFAARDLPVPGLGPRPPTPVPLRRCVAREDELAWLDRCLEDSLGGSGRMVFLSGPAGSGKTVLVDAFAAEARQRVPDLVALRGSCNAFSGPGDPYLPFRQILGLLCGDLADAWARGQLTPREASLLWAGMPATVETIVNEGPDLLGTLIDGAGLLRRLERQHPEEPLLEALGAAAADATRRAQDPSRPVQPLLDQCTRVLTRLASQRPMLLAIDDAHWADAGTIDLLRHISDRVGTTPVLVIVAFRPSEMPVDEGRVDPVAMLAREVQVNSSADCVCELTGSRHFVDAWLDTEPNRLDPSFRDRLYRTTNGHALFTVETVAAMQERRDLTLDSENRWIAGDTVAWDKLPPRVEAAIAARTTQLPTEVRRDLDAASVQGHDFLADVAAAARGATSEELGSRLAELTATSHPLVEFVGVADVSGRRVDRYRFRHDTFRQAMEDGLAAPDRARLHEATGRALADLYADRLDEVAVDLARHFDAAGLVDEAITAHERAGRQAIRMSATSEAIVHLRRAVELLDGQDASAERDTHTLGLLSALGTCLQAHAGYNAPTTHDVYERIRALIPVVGATMESAEALGALIAIDALRARYGAATEGADRLLAIARSLGAPVP